MNDSLWKTQMNINDQTNTQIRLLIQQIDFLIRVVEDHEKDMKMMADEINSLKYQLSQKAES